MPIKPRTQSSLRLVKVVPGPYLDFDLREILSDKDESEQYREPDRKNTISVCRFYTFVTREMASVVYINEHHSYSMDVALCACASYGADNCASNPAYREWRTQKGRFLGWGGYGEGDKTDVWALLGGLRFTENDGGEGSKRQRNIRCPDTIQRQIGKLAGVLEGVSMSSLTHRFIMDGLRKQPGVEKEYKGIMDFLVDEMYKKIAKQARKVRNHLNGLGVPQ